MRNILLVTVIAFGAATAAFAQERIALKDGAGRAVTENICSGCHSLD